LKRLEERLIFGLASVATIGIPFVISAGRDGFRIGKEILFVAAGTAVAGLMVAVALAIAPPFRKMWMHRRAEVVLTSAVVIWTAIAALFSVQQTLSFVTLAWVVAGAALFIAMLGGAIESRFAMLNVAILPAAVNALIAISQRAGWWSPVALDPNLPARIRTSGLVGNPNDLAAYLLLPLIASVAIAIVQQGKVRWIYAAISLVILAGVAASETVTATAALLAGLFAMAFLTSRRAALALAAAFLSGMAIASYLELPLVLRLFNVLDQATAGDFLAATSNRTQSWLIGWQMFLEHPLTGVGPGCYGLMYLAYKISLSKAHPEFLASPENFGETHNDHLQTLAVSGLPGYFLLIGALLLLGSVTFRTTADGLRGRFAKLFAFPSAIALAVLMFGQFPLELAAPLIVILYLSALALAWRTPCEP
jgi:O-antigen ligase